MNFKQGCGPADEGGTPMLQMFLKAERGVPGRISGANMGSLKCGT